jgi:hypothetical protein
MVCPQCGGQLPGPGVGRPRRFCSDVCRKRWHNDTSILRNELAWRLSLGPSTPHNAAEAARLTDLIARRR